MTMGSHCGMVWLLLSVLLFLQTEQTAISNSCKINNGNCEQFCKAGHDGVVCSCAHGYALGSDNKTCVPVGFTNKNIHENNNANNGRCLETLSSTESTVKFPCGKIQSSHETHPEDTGTTASLEAHPEQEESAETLSNHTEAIGEADSLPTACPWQAVLLQEGDDLFCGGTILNEYFILTAAHCVKQPREIVILVGDVDREKQEQSEAMHRVEKIIIHDAFDFETYDSDIALIKLKERIKFSEYVIPACLPEEDFSTEVLMKQPYGIISGFGRLSPYQRLVRRMKVFQIPYVDMDTCKPAIRNLVTENMFCAGYNKDGRDACSGDGGGPHVTQYNGTYFVTGIISWGEGCGTPGKYGIYTNLSKFLPWVRSILDQNS